MYPGCNDDEAVNFVEAAGCDDGSCIYEGCTIDLACNYNPLATIEDGSCEFGSCPGCNDVEALNYNPTSTNNEVCVYELLAQIEVTSNPWPYEVSWQIESDSGEIIISGSAPFVGEASFPRGTYTLYAQDSYGDGWNGSSLTITANGELILAYSLSSGSYGQTSFSVGE